MKIKLTVDFNFDLNDIVDFISKDKPKAASKFKNELIKNLKKDLLNPYSFKKSIYFDDEAYRDYVFKGYTIIVKIDSEQEIVSIIGVLRCRNSF